MKKLKPKQLTKQACERAIKRFTDKQRKTKEYWDKKMEEAKTKTLLDYKKLKFPEKAVKE